ncbi:MAG: BatD family protein, partial [Verrucomicrobiota bacterium]
MMPNVFSAGWIIATPARASKWLCWFSVLMTLLMASSLQAEPVATASISANTMTMGDSVQLTISVQGARELRRPNQIAVPGLAIHSSGDARRMLSMNGKATLTVDVMYTIEAQKAGAYTIPAIEILADGQSLKTAPLSLTVLAAPPSTEGEEKPIFAEITMPKTKAYLGETIPVELRLYIETGIRWRAEQMPSFEGEGFTKQKMPEPRQDRAR